jgi:putative transposase
MARIARVVLPGIPHHVTQRGVRSLPVFFSDRDRKDYLSSLAKEAKRHGLRFWAWCLMTNHVHLIVVPQGMDSLARGIGEAHKRYTRMINLRQGTRGFLFQGRFFSCPLDERHLYAAVRYVLRNPVRAGIVDQPEDYRWSSARRLLGLIDQDPLVRDLGPLHNMGDWKESLGSDPTDINSLRKYTRTGRPYGDNAFITTAEKMTGRDLRKHAPGRKVNRK